MGWVVLGALVIGILAVVAAGVRLGRSALAGWRTFKRLRGSVFAELDRLAAATAASAEKAEQAADLSRLDESLARLHVTVRRFNVLREAMDEATDAVGRVRSVYRRR